MIHVQVKPAVLRWAVERSGQRSALERKFPKLGSWLGGEGGPTMKQLEALAKGTLTPFGFFFLDQPPEEKLPIPLFRTLDDQPTSRPSAELLETVYTMERRQGWMRDYLIEQGQERLSYVGSAAPQRPPQALAVQMRDALGLGSGWAGQTSTWMDALRQLERRMETVGILVVVNGVVGNNTRRKLNVEEFRGFVLVDPYAPLVFVNGADGKAAQMFTLAHELAHLWFGKSAAFDLRQLQPASDPTEQACNRLAAEFLVPEEELRSLWPALTDTTQPFQQIARQYKVSELVAARRALDLKLIDKEEFFRFYNDYIQRQRRRGAEQKGGNFYENQNLRVGRRFAEAVARAVGEGELLYREAYHLTGLYGEAFQRYVASLSSTEAA